MISESIEVAKSHGWLDDPVVQDTVARMPDWLAKLADRSGLAALSDRFEGPVPMVLQEFYSHRSFVAFFEHALMDGGVFFPECRSEELPLIPEWDGGRHIAVCEPYSDGTVLGLDSSSADPYPRVGGPIEMTPDMLLEQTFSEWVYSTVNLYEVNLNSCADMIRRVESNRTKRREFGAGYLNAFRNMPGMKNKIAPKRRKWWLW